jgi:hypothetical protein
VADTRYVLGPKLGLELCEMFGLDHRNVTAISLHAEVDRAAYVVVEMLADRNKLDALMTRRFELLEVTDG